MQKPISIKLYILLLIVFLLGAAVLAYPPFSAWWNDAHQAGEATAYVAFMENSQEDYSQHLEEAKQFNENLRKSGAILTDPFDFETLKNVGGNYDDMLNVTEIMATIDIPSIKVNLPIYHGSEDDTLKKGIGHLSTTSLPVGGKGSHCVLTGHTGLPGKTLFTDLIKLKTDDIFSIHVLDEVLTYQVDQIDVILPSEIEKLVLDQDEDYVTLVTCTPYGVNDHRLLVRGTRIFPEQMSQEEEERIMQKAREGKSFSVIEIVQFVTAIIAFLLFILFLVKLFLALRFNRRLRDEEK